MNDFLIFFLSLHQLENNELKMPKFYDKVNVLRKPEWLKIRLQSNDESAEVERIVKEHSLHTICSSGLCPNKAECWRRMTATFMILGDVCTRGCKFCATLTGKPLAPDASEPEKVAESSDAKYVYKGKDDADEIDIVDELFLFGDEDDE